MVRALTNVEGTNVAGFSLLLVFALLRGYFSSPPVSLPPEKLTFPANSNSTWIEDPHANH